MTKHFSKIRIFLIVIFLVYFSWLLYFTIFAESLGRVYEDVTAEPRYNLVPFAEIGRFLTYGELLGKKAVFLNIIGNILAFVPTGLLLPAITERARGFTGIFVIGLSESFLIECTQLIFRVGSFDVDDLLLNTAGVLIGFAIWRLICYILKKRRLLTPVSIRRL